MLELYKKASGNGDGAGFHVPRPTSLSRLHKSSYSIMVYPDGNIEIVKNRYENVKGFIDIEYSIKLFSEVLAKQKLKDTKLKMFKEGLSKLLQEAINKTLEGGYYENTVFTESGCDGIEHRGSP
jgi:hypothetical protein